MSPEPTPPNKSSQSNWINQVPNPCKVIIVNTHQAADLITKGVPPGRSIETKTDGDTAYRFITKQDRTQE